MKKIKSLYVMLVMISIIISFSGCERVIHKENFTIQFSTSSETIQLEYVNILSGEMDILIPDNFLIMPEEIKMIKYPRDDRPELVYTNEDISVNIAFTLTKNTIRDEQIEEYLNNIKKSFENQIPSIKILKSEMTVINGKSIGVLEMITPAADTDIYNLFWITDLDGRLLCSSFNCIIADMNDWKPIAYSIMDSLLFK